MWRIMILTYPERIGEIKLAVKLRNEGVRADPQIFKSLDFENEYLEQVHGLFSNNKLNYTESKIPAAFRLSSGLLNDLIYSNSSSFSLKKENGKFILYEGEQYLDSVTFQSKPAFYNKKTSDGVQMSTVAQYNGKNKLLITYSNECALQNGGVGCLFCNINATKRMYGDSEKIKWKNARQIAETVREAYSEGFTRFTLTGGFIPERREIEYYVDVGEAVKAELGSDNFNGTAVIGAPLDLSIIDKYKVAGFSSIGTNIEVWNSDLFKYLCPGKEKYCGGWDNWLRVLKHDVEVFGRSNVRTLFLAGLEARNSLLEGAEAVAEFGVIPVVQSWFANIGSDLEGHRSPESEWLFDVYKKAYGVLKKHGYTHKQFFNVAPGAETILDYFYDADGDFLYQ
jgi:hypothetical protein